MQLTFVKNLVLAVLLGSASFAFAADNNDAAASSDCAVPNFHSEQHTYISAALAHDQVLQRNLSGLAQGLTAAGNDHGIVTYLVACQANYEQGVPGVALANGVFSQWQANSDFPWSDKVVVIAWVRNGLDTDHGSVGAEAGQALKDLGFTADKFAASDGPVLSNIRQFMPLDPNGEFVEIVRQINSGIDQAKDDARRNAELNQFLLRAGAVLLVVLVLGAIVVLVRKLWLSHVKNENARIAIRQNDSIVSNELSSAQAIGRDLAACAVPFAPYEKKLNRLLDRQQEINRSMRSLPLDMVRLEEALLADARHFHEVMVQALGLQRSTLPELQTAINRARENAQFQRQQPVVYMFPNINTPADLSGLFQLSANGGNPDVEIAAAVEAVAAAAGSLIAGDVEKAQQQCNLAASQIEKAHAIVADTLAAQTGAEEVVATIKTQAGNLLQSCHAGQEQLAALKGEFALANYKDVAGNVETARQAAKGVDNVIAEAAAEYFQQDFLAAKARLDQLMQKLTEAQKGVSAIAGRQTELAEKRVAILANLAETGKVMQAVDKKISGNKGTTGSSTNQMYQRLQEDHASLSQVSARNDSSVNWLAMYVLWQAFSSSAHQVSSRIDSDRSSYEAAQSAYSYQQTSMQSFTIDTSSSATMGGAGGGNY